jgi:hypothetical protein
MISERNFAKRSHKSYFDVSDISSHILDDNYYKIADEIYVEEVVNDSVENLWNLNRQII